MGQVAVRMSRSDVERNEQVLRAELAEAKSALAAKTEELERSERRPLGGMSPTFHVLWKTDAKGHMQGKQPEWESFTGQTIEEYQGLGWRTAVHPEDVPLTIKEWDRAAAERKPLLFEHRVRRHDGVYLLFSLSAVHILNDEGSVREWAGVHHDITEQRKTLEEMLAREVKFRFLCDSMPQIVWAARPDGWRDYYNPQWFHYTGTTFEQTEGWGWKQFLHPDDLENCLRVWKQSIATGKLYQLESRFKCASDGAYRWHLSRACPLLDKDGNVLKWFGTCTDINDFKEAEAVNLRLTADLESRVSQRTSELERVNVELKSFSRVLEMSNGVLQDFASVAAHDLQEPLRKIQAFGDRLKTGYQASLDSQGQDYLNRMLNAAGRMQVLIRDLLAFSSVTSQGAAFVRVDLARVTQEVLSDLEERISETGAVIEVGQLPVIMADPVQIRQLLQNLIGNSLKFHRKDTRPTVRVYTTTPGASRGACTLVVEDNGIGFDEKYLDRIFTVFQRLHGRTEYEGTGVGLAICRKIAQVHGGDITATSRPNVGSTFIVALAPALSQCGSCIRPIQTSLTAGNEKRAIDFGVPCGKKCL